jgi:cytochrome P450
MADARATTRADESLPKETPPGPSGWPLLGNTLQLVRDPFAFYETLDSYGDVVSYRVAGQQFCTVLHPDYVETVLFDPETFGKWGFEEFGSDFAPEGVLLTEGEQWRKQRTILQDAFTLDRIETYARTMSDYAAEMVDDWDDGQEVALNREFSKLTLRILAHSLFDLDLRERGDLVTEFAETLNDRADVGNVSAFVPDWVPLPSNRRYRRVRAEFRSFVDDLMDERRGRTDEYDDLLSILLGAQAEEGSLTDDEVRDQMVTFLFAGHETTSLALTYAFLALSTHDDARDKLDAEHAEVLGGSSPTVADVPALDYTGQVIDETLRLYPPAYIMFREAREDTALGGYRIPEDTKLTVPQFRLHTDERFYDDPDRFHPERWDGDLEAELPDYAYFPFGGGPRHCIGMRFAMMELRTVIPTVAQSVRFDLQSDPDPDFRAGATLQPAADVVARVHKRP